ncbi:MAG: hypothetical protein ACR2RL_00400, partial [Gammaproteobacteria bacterium]
MDGSVVGESSLHHERTDLQIAFVRIERVQTLYADGFKRTSQSLSLLMTLHAITMPQTLAR